MTTKSFLLKLLGSSVVRLSSANTYSYDKIDVTFSHYVENHLKPQDLRTQGNGEICMTNGIHFHKSFIPTRLTYIEILSTGKKFFHVILQDSKSVLIMTEVCLS